MRCSAIRGLLECGSTGPAAPCSDMAEATFCESSGRGGSEGSP